MKNDSESKCPNPNKPLQVIPSKKELIVTPKPINVYNSTSIKRTIKDFRNMNKAYIRKKKKSQKNCQAVILQVKAPDGNLSIKRLLINDKIPEQVNYL